MSFGSELIKFEDKALIDTAKTRRAAVIAIVNRLAKRTPVDTGRAAGNWFTSVSKPSTETYTDADPADSIVNARAVNMDKLEEPVYITNNLPYIKRLNNGSSTQAPRGFVQTAVLDVKNLLNKNGIRVR